jgi:uncharacterized protein (TIGR02996 family)
MRLPLPAEFLNLMAAAKQHPEDDAPRLVLADWLEEHGDQDDLARAECIRLDVELSHLPESSPRRAAAWQRRCRLWPTDPCLGVVTDCLTLVTDLDLSGRQIGNKGATILANSSAVAHLVHLDLSENKIGARGVAALAGSPHLAALTRLNLSRNSIGPQGARALARSASLTRLNHLAIGYCDIGSEGLSALAASGVLANVNELDLTNNAIDGGGGRGSGGFGQPGAAHEFAAGFQLDRQRGRCGNRGVTCGRPTHEARPEHEFDQSQWCAGAGQFAPSGWVEGSRTPRKQHRLWGRYGAGRFALPEWTDPAHAGVLRHRIGSAEPVAGAVRRRDPVRLWRRVSQLAER